MLASLDHDSFWESIIYPYKFDNSNLTLNFILINLLYVFIASVASLVSSAALDQDGVLNVCACTVY